MACVEQSLLFAKTSASWHSFPDSPTRVHKSIMANSINSIQILIHIQNTKLKSSTPAMC